MQIHCTFLFQFFFFSLNLLLSFVFSLCFYFQIGGETKFNKLNDLKVKPRKGRALVWPSVLDDDPNYFDSRMYHEAMPVIKGKKYAANHWIHQYDFRKPNEWGCTGSFA